MSGIATNVKTAFTIDQFRETFPVFASEETFPDSSITMYSELAAISLNKGLFGRFWVYCCGLFVAHYLAIDQNILEDGTAGFGPGGMQTSASQNVGGASFSEGYSNGFWDGAGDFAKTAWGRILWRYIRMFGAGGGVAWNTRQKSLTGL